MSGAGERYIDAVVEVVSRRVPDLRVSSRAAAEAEDISNIELLHPDFPPVDLLVATDARYVKVLVGRYVFDAVPLDDLDEFAHLFSGTSSS